MSYAPRGYVKTILDAMAKQDHDLEWTAQELADIAGIGKLAVSSTLRCALNHQAVFCIRKGREFAYSLTAYETADEQPQQEEEAEAEVVPFAASLWLDGDLIIYGATETEDGGMLITKDQLAQIKRMVTWSAPA